jgi:penicillin-insensitive murein endopeptidase
MKIKTSTFLKSISTAPVLMFAIVIQPVNYDQSSGQPDAGFLRNASALKSEGKGYVKLFRSRERQYGSSELVQLIEQVSAEMSQVKPCDQVLCERLQVGDLSQQKGGDIDRHGSHENGLDVDLVYFRTNHREQSLNETDGFTENFVQNNRVTKNFDLQRNWIFLKTIVSSGIVNRMFVDPVIKKTYCDLYQEQSKSDDLVKETLRRMRVLEEHGDHVHVRILCPKNSPLCTEQAPPPEGTGC